MPLKKQPRSFFTAVYTMKVFIKEYDEYIDQIDIKLQLKPFAYTYIDLGLKNFGFNKKKKKTKTLRNLN